MTDSTVLPLELRRAGDHTLEGLCVPYDRTTMKAGYPHGERFLPGAFADVTTRSGQTRIRLTDSHIEGDARRPVGIATELRDTSSGLFGTFRFYNTPEGRGAWENVTEGTYGGLSVGFVPVTERRAADGAREIVKARLFHVSLVDEPAYDEAKVLAVRHALPDVSELLAVDYRIEDMPEEVDLSRLVWGR
jgi:HK97 family phage prohead protease